MGKRLGTNFPFQRFCTHVHQTPIQLHQPNLSTHPTYYDETGTCNSPDFQQQQQPLIIYTILAGEKKGGKRANIDNKIVEGL